MLKFTYFYCHTVYIFDDSKNLTNMTKRYLKAINLVNVSSEKLVTFFTQHTKTTSFTFLIKTRFNHFHNVCYFYMSRRNS